MQAVVEERKKTRFELESDYWDKAAKKRFTQHPNGEVTYFDNFYKRSQILRNLLNYDFGKMRVLEIGCGLPSIFAALRNCANLMHYKATDVSVEYCKYARKLCKADVRHAKAKSLPFESGTFDYLFAFDVFEHIHPEERMESFVEISRVLKPSANLFMNNPLTASRHDPEFDFEFNDMDIMKMARLMKMKIDIIKRYSIPVIQDGEQISYQWIVMHRGTE